MKTHGNLTRGSLYGARGTQIRGECHQAKIGEFVEGEEVFFFLLSNA